MPVPNTSNIIQPNISTLVPYQFPQFYQDNYPVFLAFVKAYYQYLEQQGNPLYYSRNFLNLTDIDKTLDSFLVFFKEKYFVNIQLNTQADTRQLIKHALDIYRSKGTEREIQLLFQLLFDEQISFYYPKNDIFRLSYGTWYVPTYLELTLLSSNILLNQKEIVGVTSGAIAFVDSVIRRRGSKSSINDIAYISGVIGNFEYGERIIPTDGSLNSVNCPLITGSLSAVEITSSGNTANYNIGDTVNIISPTGEGGIARVTGISNVSGLLSITLNDGGYAYTPNATCYISNAMLISNVQNITNSFAQQYFKPFETIVQPMALINYINANGNFNTGDTLSAYSNSTTFSGNGIILTIATTNSTAGTLLVSTVNGSLNANLLFNQGNVVSANIATSNGYTNASATGQVIGNSNSTLNFLISNGNFLVGESVAQYIDNGPAYVGIGNLVSISNSLMILGNVEGVFRPNFSVIGLTSGATANITTLNLNIGVVNVNGTFNSLPHAYYISDSTNGMFSIVATGNNDAGFQISNTLLFTEVVNINSDLLSTFANVSCNATAYGFPANASVNATSGNVSQAMSFTATTIGKIGSIIQFNHGSKYNVPQFIAILEPKTYGEQLQDVTMYVTGLSQPFLQGELITQSSTNARALIQFSNTTYIQAQNLRYNTNNQFIQTTNSTTTIVGSNTGLVANVVNVYGNPWDIDEGFNANGITRTQISTGSITNLEVIDSGFNYIQNQDIIFGNANNGFGTGIAFLLFQGQGTGLYTQKGGFLSDIKKLFDGDFYQEFSYQIQSSQTLDKYQKTLKSLGHVAGIKLFGQTIHKASWNNKANSHTSVTTISNYTLPTSGELMVLIFAPAL